MNKRVLTILAVAAVVSPLAVWVVRAQSSKPMTATYISKEEIDTVGKDEQGKSTQDSLVKTVDLGYENFALGIIHRGTTHRPPNAGGGGGGGGTANAANANAPAPQPCGRHMDTLPPGGTPGALTHDFQTEGYLIISGAGTMMTDGYIVNGRHTDIQMNGWSCGGMAYDVKKVEVKAGDVIVVPPGVVHGWADIPDHVDYLSFRPSQKALEAGYVNPLIQNMKP
jgi:mannose-6-phosphate isomerase-like protein (cupin superfamily)